MSFPPDDLDIHRFDDDGGFIPPDVGAPLYTDDVPMPELPPALLPEIPDDLPDLPLDEKSAESAG